MERLPDLAVLGRLDERLREVAVDAGAAEAAAAAARDALAAEREPCARVLLLGYLGNALRLLGRGHDAAAAHREALALAEPGSRAAVAARVRLGEALRCDDRFEEAERELRQAVAAARAGHPELLDFALQHLGKTLVDAGDAAVALPLLDEALALREAKGDAALVESTRLALARARCVAGGQ